jgi:hypothetical protein
MKRCILVDDNQSVLTNIQQWSFDIEIVYVDWADQKNRIVHDNDRILDVDEIDEDVPLNDKNRKWRDEIKLRDFTW